MIHVVSKKALLRFKSRQDLSWLFLGSAEGFSFAARHLYDTKRLFIGRMLQEVIDEVRDRFVDYVGAMACCQADKILWYSSRLASKANSQTLIFHHYVYYKLLERLSSWEGGDILVATDDIDFLELVRRIDSRHIRAIGSTGNLMRGIFEYLEGWRRLLRLSFFWILSRSCPAVPAQSFDVILHSWIDQRTFASSEKFIDPYLGDLEEWLKQEGLTVGRVVPLIISRRFLGLLRTRFKMIFYPFRTVSFTELLHVFWCRFNARMPHYEGVDAHLFLILFSREIVKENRTKEYLPNLLLFYGYRRLFKDLKETAVVIYPFENQSWEKILLLALPEGIKKVAYSHSVLQYNWLSSRTSRLETCAPTPDVILTMGSWWADFLRSYYPDIPVEVAGALRYVYLRTTKHSVMPTRDPKTIVVALTIDPLVSNLLQTRVLSLAEQGVLDGFAVKIKPHPYLPDHALLKKSFSKYANCSFVEDKIGDLLKSCGLLITASSTVAYESLALGVKTFVYVPEAISWGIEYFIKDYIFLAYEDNFQEKFFEAIKSNEHPEWDAGLYFGSPEFSVFLRHIRGRK